MKHGIGVAAYWQQDLCCPTQVFFRKQWYALSDAGKREAEPQHLMCIVALIV